jgi:mono/diheme cytochrome c family protein
MRTARRTRVLAALGIALVAAGPVLAQAPAFAPRDEQVEDLPEGPGREETFGMCSACHAYRLVSNQGMTRERWDETMTWMTQRHGMPDIQGADRDLILDYLARNHPPRAPARGGGFRNPFAPQ